MCVCVCVCVCLCVPFLFFLLGFLQCFSFLTSFFCLFLFFFVWICTSVFVFRVIVLLLLFFRFCFCFVPLLRCDENIKFSVCWQWWKSTDILISYDKRSDWLLQLLFFVLSFLFSLSLAPSPFVSSLSQLSFCLLSLFMSCFFYWALFFFSLFLTLFFCFCSLFSLSINICFVPDCSSSVVLSSLFCYVPLMRWDKNIKFSERWQWWKLNRYPNQ